MAITQIRQGVFETNSSSTHSITVCTQDEYDKIQDGEMFVDGCSDILISKDQLNTMLEHSINVKEFTAELSDDWFNNKEERKFVLDFFDLRSWDDLGNWLEFYDYSFTTPSGDEMVAFGEYGRDG